MEEVDHLEAVHQELHAAKQQIKVLNATVNHLSAENNDLHHELSSLTEKGNEDRVRLKSASDMCQSRDDKVSDLTDRLQLTLEEKELLERKVEELMSALSSLQDKNQSDAGKSVVCLCEKEVSTLQLQLEHLQSEMELKSTRLANTVLDLERAVEKYTNMKTEVEELETELECVQCQASSQCSIIQCQREELDALRNQAESSSVCVDFNRKGNSLFSEVEDRRILVETKMVKTLDKMDKMETKFKKEHKENQRLKNQVSLLMRSSNKASEKTVRALEQEVEESKNKIIKLTQQLAQSQPVRKTLCDFPTSTQPLSDGDANMVTFLKATVTNLQKERENVTKEKNDLHIQNVQLDFLWTQKKNEVRSLTTEKDRLMALTTHQALVIESLKDESDSSEDAGPKEMTKISHTNLEPMIDLELNTDNGKTNQQTGDCNLIHSDTQTSGSANKENASCNDLRSVLLGSKSKAVTFSTGDDILSDLKSNQSAVDMPIDGDGSNKGGNSKRCDGKRKFHSMSYVNMEDVQPEESSPECKQQ